MWHQLALCSSVIGIMIVCSVGQPQSAPAWIHSFALVQGQYDSSDSSSDKCPVGDIFWVVDNAGHVSLNVGQKHAYLNFGLGHMKNVRPNIDCSYIYKSDIHGTDQISYEYQANCTNPDSILRYNETLAIQGVTLQFTHVGITPPNQFKCTLVRRHTFTKDELSALREGFFDFWDLTALPIDP